MIKNTANKRINTDNLLRCTSQISGYARRYLERQKRVELGCS